MKEIMGMMGAPLDTAVRECLCGGDLPHREKGSHGAKVREEAVHTVGTAGAKGLRWEWPSVF